MFKLGIITIVLCKLFLIASTQETVEFCDNADVCHDILQEDIGMTTFVNPFDLTGPFSELPKNELSIASCDGAPDDPDYSSLVGASLGVIPVAGAVFSWFVTLFQLADSINKSSTFYGCGNKDNLQIQLDRVLAQAIHADRENDARRAKNEAEDFVRKLSTYEGGSTLDKQSFNTVSSVAIMGEQASTNAATADILGAEILGQVALILASVQLIQISKAKDMCECDPIVKQLVNNNIDYAINKLEEIKLKNEGSKDDFECKEIQPLRMVSQGQCDNGKYECTPRGDIVFNSTSTIRSGRHKTRCARWGDCCNNSCGPTGCHVSCRECCNLYECPSDIRGLKLTLARNAVEEKFEEQFNLWWEGGQKNPNDEGVKFYYDKLKKLKEDLTIESVTKVCMRGLDSPPDPSLTPLPCPSPTPSPTPSPIPSTPCSPPGPCGNYVYGQMSENCKICCSGETKCRTFAPTGCTLDCI